MAADEPAAEKPPTPALAALRHARERLGGYSSIKADILEKISIPDRMATASHSFLAKGSYLQGQNLQMRLAFSLELGGNQGSLLEVCDGQILWTRHDIGTETQITRRDVREILKAAQQHGKTPQNILVAELGLGGLPGLFAAMEQEMDLDTLNEQVLEGRPVLILEGGWTTAFLDKFTGEIKKGEERPPLPPFVPDRVRITLDKETEFPRRIEYLKPLPRRQTLRPMLTIEFLKPAFNVPIADEEFLFVPPDQPSHDDITNEYIRRMIGPQALPGAAPNGAPAAGATEPAPAPAPRPTPAPAPAKP